MKLGAKEGWNIPADRPFYPELPATYRNVKIHNVFFKTDPEAVARFVPNPFEPDPEGLCSAIGLDIPFCTAYGPFLEAAIQYKCSFRGEEGWFSGYVFHDGPAGIAAGREIYGTAKIFSGLDIKQYQRMMTTEACMAGEPVMSVQTVMNEPCEPEDIPKTAPSWRLKIIPRADGPGPAIKQIINGSKAAQNVTVHASFKGTGAVRFDANGWYNMTSLEPIEYLDAYYTESSFQETYAEVVYDFLANG